MQTRKIAVFTGMTALTLLMAASAYAQGLTSEDFVRKASVANKFEIETSQLALEKSQNEDIKSFAQTMVDDHGKTGSKLEETLKSSNTEAQVAEELDPAHQKLLTKLEKSSGANFDKQYIAVQTDAHKQAISLFTDYSKNGKDQALKQFASDTLPDLKEHLSEVKQLKAGH